MQYKTGTCYKYVFRRPHENKPQRKERKEYEENKLTIHSDWLGPE